MQRHPEAYSEEDAFKKELKIQRILKDFRGLKEISAIRGKGGKHMIETLARSDGEIVSDRQAVADVFASFYETLYWKDPVGQHEAEQRKKRTNTQPLTLFTHDELLDALKILKRGKAKDDSGIVA